MYADQISFRNALIRLVLLQTTEQPMKDVSNYYHYVLHSSLRYLLLTRIIPVINFKEDICFFEVNIKYMSSSV